MRFYVLALICSCSALAAQAQDLIAQAAPSDAAPSSGVYVHDSATAMDKIALAERLESLKEWAKSADVYQEIVEKFADRVVACHLDDNGAADQYTSVLSLVNQHLRTWPPEGLSIYRTRYELTAQNLLRSAHGDDLAPLHEAFSRYFVTDSGKQAGLKLIDAYFELGDFPAAAWIGQAMLLHPNLGDQRPGVLFRLGLAAHLSGDDKTAATALDELKTRFPAITGTVGGQNVTLSDSLATYLSRTPADQLTAVDGDSWPMFGGDPSRGCVSLASARPGAMLYSVTLPAPDWKNVVQDPTQRKALEQQDQEWRRQGKATGIMPAVDRGELFFQDNSHIYARDLETDAPLPGWLDTYPNQNGSYILSADGRPPTGAISMPTGYQLCVTVTDTSVLAIMGVADPLALQYGAANQQDGKIVCLDRQTGRENWSLSARDLPPDNLKTIRFGGSPLVAGGNVYLAALGDEGKGYEDSYVVCLDLATGAYRWSAYVAGAPNAGQTVMNNNNQITSLLHVPTHLAYSSGRIFVATDVGAVAALDAYNGNVKWLNLYREADEAVNPSFMPMGGMGGFGWGGGFNPGMMAPGAPWDPPSPWTANAPIVRDGNVFVLPTDGKYLLIYDAGDGHVVKKLRKSDCCLTQSDEGTDPANTQPDTLLGVLDGVSVREEKQDQREDLLLVATPIHVVAIKWRDYDPDHPRDAIAWASDQGEPIRGRPFLTADSVFIPTEQMLYRVAVRNGEIKDTYPAENKSVAADASAQETAWPAGEGPGNVLVCGDLMVIAGDRSLCVYTNLSVARAKLDQEIAAAPADPNARLHYAEVMSLANQPEEAVQKLDEAIGLLRTPASRQRAFSDALNFATRNDGPATAALFDRAATLAQSPGEQVHYRLARARFDRRGPQPDFAAAIALYEEILADNALRTTPTPPEAADQPASAPPAGQQADIQAGLAAQTAIATILKDPAGAAAYQPIEHAAAAKFADAEAANDAGALLSIATHYPNSSVAQHAELAAAAAFAVRGSPRQAALALRDVYGDLTDNKLKLLALDAMARNYLQIPGSASTAAGRLAAAAQLDGTAKLPAPLALGSDIVPANTSFADAADKVAHFARQQEQAALVLPAFALPTPAERRAYRNRFGRSPDPFAQQPPQISDVDTLLAIDQDSNRFDRVATWTQGKGASIFAIGAQQPLGTIPDITEEPRGASWVNGAKDLLVWTGTQVVLIDGQKLQSRWMLGLTNLPDLGILAPESQAPSGSLIQQMNPRMLRRMTRQNLIPIRNRPFVARQLPTAADGAPVADDSSDDASTGPESFIALTIAGDVALLSTSSGRVLALNLADGSLAWEERFADHAVDRVAATPDFTVIKTSDESAAQLAVLDTSTGRMLARKSFSIDSGEFPVNLAVDTDGTLAYTTPSHIVIHDLFGAASDPNLENIRNPTEALQERPFADLTRPGQLLLHDGQILAICDGGASLRGYSAQTGALREFTQDSRLTPMVLATGRHSDDVVLRIGGDYAYVWSGGSVAAYNLDAPQTCWGPQEIGAPGAARQLLVGKDFLVLLNQSPASTDPPSWTVSAFSRALVGDQSAESGLLVWQPTQTDPHGIIAWQPVDGGFCYLAGDRSVHWLPGNPHPSAQ